MRLLSKILVTSIFTSLLVAITGTSPALAAAPAAPGMTRVGAILANEALWAGVYLNTSSAGANISGGNGAVSAVTFEATTGSLNSPTPVASCSIQFGETRAQIMKRCKIVGLSNLTAYNVRAKLSNSAGETAWIWASTFDSLAEPDFFTPSGSAVRLHETSRDCSVFPQFVRPCHNQSIPTPVVISGQNLGTCTRINAIGGTAHNIVVTPSGNGSSISFTIPIPVDSPPSANTVGSVTFNCGLSQIQNYFGNSAVVGSLSQIGFTPTWSSSSGSTAGGNQVVLTSFSSVNPLFVGVTGLTLGGNPVTYEVVDNHTMRLTVPAGSAGPANLVMTNSNGTGTQGGAYTYIAPPQPGTPGKATAIAGAGSATITPVAPSSGGAPSSYVVLASPSGLTCTVTLPATSCQITGLTNGTPYTFTTTATNAGGTSSSSVASDPVTPTAPASSSSSIPAAAPQKQHTNTMNTTPAPGETVSMFGSFFDRVTEAFVGGVKVEIVSKSDNRVNIRMPRGLTGALDVELKSPLGTLLLPKHFTIGKLPAAGGQQTTLTVGGFEPNSRKLTARMQARIDRWLERNSNLSTLTCTGFTSLPRRTTDVQLSTNRGTTACNFAKSQRPELTTSVSQGVEDPRPGSNVRRVKLVLTP